MGISIAAMTTNMEKTDLVCTQCGTEFYIYRSKGRLREKGHIKDIWCYVCQEVTPHREEKISKREAVY